ncbi:hypothetical protein NEISICOT_01255 [Neisseria sicca ATCC 29256]|uniref:Uncharacterized protein n=1 Tax=Neisseria sicca ATCC 29256 TaxID=547045 RepID=C6M412_NEISI|nr:hypothetical protein NEISICOT_01255 [Neisseria sicca ATCC 29256]
MISAEANIISAFYSFEIKCFVITACSCFVRYVLIGNESGELFSEFFRSVE